MASSVIKGLIICFQLLFDCDCSCDFCTYGSHLSCWIHGNHYQHDLLLKKLSGNRAMYHLFLTAQLVATKQKVNMLVQANHALYLQTSLLQHVESYVQYFNWVIISASLNYTPIHTTRLVLYVVQTKPHKTELGGIASF